MKKDTSTILKVLLGLLVLSAIILLINNNSSVDSNAKNETANISESLTFYTQEDVATHKIESDCWTTIADEVYNLTPYIKMHPGGEGSIVRLCGIDGIEAFSAKHGENPRAKDELLSLKIGEIKN